MNDAPVACSLGDPERRQREAWLLASLAGRVVAAEALPEGVRLRFAGDDQTLADVAELVQLERACCRFLRFAILAEPEGGPLTLELTGPSGTLEFLAETPLRFAVCALGSPARQG